MIAPNTNDSENAAAAESAIPQSKVKTRDLHVKGIPEAIWCRARCNATQSGMTFKDYMIALLAISERIERQA
jgi:hypothetical protein